MKLHKAFMCFGLPIMYYEVILFREHEISWFDDDDDDGHGHMNLWVFKLNTQLLNLISISLGSLFCGLSYPRNTQN